MGATARDLIKQAAEVDGAYRQWLDLAEAESTPPVWRQYLALRALRNERVSLAIAMTKVDALRASVAQLEIAAGLSPQQELPL